MVSFLRSLLASMLGVLLVLAVILGVAAWRLDSQSDIQKHTWLHLDLYGDLPEYDPPSGLAGALGGGQYAADYTYTPWGITKDVFHTITVSLAITKEGGPDGYTAHLQHFRCWEVYPPL